MNKYCQNPLCENEATNTVAVSADGRSKHKRALCAACKEAYTWGLQQERASAKGLRIEPPPKERGPQPLYRVVYTIDVNAPNIQKAAENAYEIMTDPASMRPVLDILESSGRCTRVDLSKT
jgi:hypothetical protein